ncbi:hypothetical protein FOZ62_030060 [Perkinsus olseni]|uniref:EF-hand domain-containing protein n=1 Tax=Perkinsus olseni TaxID=32597 RepID=A0A7J6QNM6_PEROL|nr:hypothetical protein FOZ62_030060 [Perkinsus olseni]
MTWLLLAMPPQDRPPPPPRPSALAARAGGTAERSASSFKDDAEASALVKRSTCGIASHSMEECENIFNLVDVDGHGYIDSDGIRSALESVCGRSGGDVKDEEITEMIRMLDSTGDGRVSRVEFLTALSDPENVITKEAGRLLTEQNRKEELARSYYRQQVENKAAVATAFGSRKGATQNFKNDAATNKGGKSKKSGRVQRQPTFVGKLTKEDPPPLAAMSGIDNEDQEHSFGNLRASSIAAQEMSERFDSSTADFVRELTDQNGGELKGDFVKRLFRRFKAVDIRRTGVIDYAQFCQILERDGSGQMEAIFKLFDNEENGSVDVREFLVGMCNFTSITGIERMRFAFMLFDEDASGSIGKEELEKIIRANLACSHGSRKSNLNRRVRAVLAAAGPNATREERIQLQDLIRVCRSNPGLLFPPTQAKDIAD